MTDDRPAMAPTSTAVASQRCPVASTPTAMGCGTLSFVYDTTPVRIEATRRCRAPCRRPSEPRMPMGMSRCGLRVSCAAVETASKPMYAKKTMVAPWSTPEMPKRPNGALVRRDERVPVGGVHEARRERDEEQDHRDLHEDDDGVEPRRLLDAADEQRRDREDDEHGGHVEDGARRSKCSLLAPRATGALVHAFGRSTPKVSWKNATTYPDQPTLTAAARDQVLEDEVPTDDPRDELAHRGVRVGVGAASDGDHRGHLRVAKAREGRRDGGRRRTRARPRARRWQRQHAPSGRRCRFR